MLVLVFLLLPILSHAQYSLQWETKPFASGANKFETALAQAVNKRDNIIIMGLSTRTWYDDNILYPHVDNWTKNLVLRDGAKIVLYKYSPTGKLLWKTSNLTGRASEHPVKLLLDASDNIYISGVYTNGTFLAKFAQNGKLLWRLEGAKLGNTTIADFVVNNDQTVHLTGTSGNNINTYQIQPNGKVKWQAVFKGSDSKGAGAYVIASDNRGGVYISTKITVNDPCNCGRPGRDDITIVKYAASTGAVLFTKDYQFPKPKSLYGTGRSDFKYPSQLLATPSGFLYLIVNQSDGFNGRQAVVAKLRGNGALVWSTPVYDSFITTHKQAALAEGEALVLLCRENTYRNLDNHLLTKIDRNGRKVWDKLLNSYGQNRKDLRQFLPKSLYVNTKGEISISGSTDSLTVHNPFPVSITVREKNTSLTAVYDRNGKLKWSVKGPLNNELNYGLGSVLLQNALVTLNGVGSTSGSKLISARYVPGNTNANTPDAWVSQSHTYDAAARRLSVNWTLHISKAQPKVTKYNVYHTATQNGKTEQFVWDMPAGKTSVGAVYQYSLSTISSLPDLVMGVATGTGYLLPNSTNRPREVRVNVANATKGSVPEAWVSQTHSYNREAGRLDIQWTLYISKAQPKVTTYKVYHSSTENGAVQNWEWEMPAGKTSVGATYQYPLARIGSIDKLVMGVNAGAGYSIPNTTSKPKEVQVVVGSATSRSTAIVAQELPDLLVYPNPTSASINIDALLGSQGPVSMKIVDITGKVIYQKQLRTEHRRLNHTIDLSAQARGMYLLHIETATEVLSRKILVE